MRQTIASPVLRYLEQHHPPLDEVLGEIRAQGLAARLPLVDAVTARFLRGLVTALPAHTILEIGTAIGYSAACMAQAMPAGGTLFTIEIDPDRAATARANLDRAGVADRVSVIVGDASRFLHKVSGPFDLIFQDGSKQLYEPLLDGLVAHLRPGGVLVTDNVLWHGEVIQGFVDPPERDPADTTAIRQYNDRLAMDPRLLTTFLSIGDGVAFSVKVGS
jgi:predicted O-methyltransferase YrrM